MAIRIEGIDPGLRLTDRLFLFVSGHLFWKKALLSVDLRDKDYTVIISSDVTSGQVIELAKKTMSKNSSVYVKKPAFNHLQSESIALGNLPNYLSEECDQLIITSPWYSIQWERRINNSLAYISEYASTSELNRFLSLGKPRLPEETFKILEDLLKNYKRDELYEQFIL